MRTNRFQRIAFLASNQWLISAICLAQFYIATTVCFSAALAAPDSERTSGNEAPITKITVMTLNAYVNASAGLAPLKNAIVAANADVVGLQEADGFVIKSLADLLKWHWTQTGGAGQYGIISRFPIVQRIGETVAPYGGMGATIELSRDQRIHLFSAHLNWTPYGPYQLQEGWSAAQIIKSEESVRLPGLLELLNLAEPFIRTSEPVFLVGDFNAPSDLDYARLNWPESIACRKVGLADSYREMHPQNRTYPGPFAHTDPGITWTPNGLQSEPRGIYDRIDFIYYSVADGLTPTFSDTVTTAGSDHRAVVTKFTVAPPMRTEKASGALPQLNFQFASIRPLLTWISGSNALSQDVHFGVTSPPDFQGNQTDSQFRPGRLLPNTTYGWRVDQLTLNGTVRGDDWRFTTGNFSWMEPAKVSFKRTENITVQFNNVKINRAWIGLYLADSAYGPQAASIDWYYLDGSKNVPAAVVLDGILTIPRQAPGSYVLRLFADSGFALLDEVPLTVTSQ